MGGQLLRAEEKLPNQQSQTFAPSKPSITFRNITKKAGLLNIAIKDIVQDKNGIIWIATTEGLYKYDGHRFISIFNETRLKGNLDDTNIVSLLLDSENKLWIMTSSALHIYDFENEKFRTIIEKGYKINDKVVHSLLNVTLTKNGTFWLVTDLGVIKGKNKSKDFKLYRKNSEKLLTLNPLRVFKIGDDKIFIGSQQDGIWKYETKSDSFKQFIVNIQNLDQNARNIRKMFKAKNGYYWLSSNNGLIKINEGGSIESWLNPKNSEWMKEPIIEDVVNDIDGNLIVATWESGLFLLTKNGDFIVQIVNKIGDSNSLTSNNTKVLFWDKDEVLWIGTRNNGISLWNKKSSFVERIDFKQGDKSGLSNGEVWSVFQDSKERLWVGTNNGLNLWSNVGKKFEYYNLGKMPSGESTEVSAIAESSDGNLWLATGLGLMNFDVGNGKHTIYKADSFTVDGLYADAIYSLFTDRRGRLWIGHNKGVSYVNKGSYKFNHLNNKTSIRNNLSNNEVGAITEDEKGHVWVGTSKGICKYILKSNNFNCYLKEYGGNTPSFTFLVNALKIIDDNAWVGYSGNGLLNLNLINKDTYLEFKKGEKFPTNNVSSLLEDKQHRLWMSSQSGLVVFNPTNNTYRVIEARDGLENSEFNESSFTKLKDGRFAFGTIQGVVIIDPEKYRSDYNIPEISLSGIYSLSDQNRIIDLEKVSLPEEKSGLKIEFSNLNYFHPEQSRYQYSFGTNKDWIDLGNKSEILFAESKSGSHQIRIRSKYLGGNWGPEKIISFDVYPPLWRNNYFLTLYVLLALGSIVFFMRYRQQQLVEKYKMLDVIKENEQQLRLSLDASEQGVWDWKTKNDFMTRSKTDELLHIDAPDTLVEYWALIEENDRLEVIQSWNSHLFGKQQNYHCQYRIKLDDEDIWIEEQGRAISRDKHGMAVHISGTYRNITHLKAIEKNLNLLAKAFEDTAEGMLVVDNELNIVQVNNAVTEITGFPSDSLIGSSISARVSMDSPISFFDEVWQGVAEKGSWQGEVWQKNVEEEDIPLWLNVSEIQDKDEHDTYYVLIMSDMSERKATEEELRYLANYDTLTKLPNRALLRDRLDHALGNARRQHRPLALLFLDLDRFKNVNDSFGHAVGDGLLKIVSERLQECLREDDTVSRLGGDEFVILMEHFSSINAIAGVTEKIRIAMTHPFRLEGIDIQASFSIGVSVYPSDGEDSATLLRNADTAMYHAKSAGRNRVQFYAPKMNETALERLTLENDLRSAVGGGQLEVYYQPQVRSHDGSIYGAEALVRWNHPTRGLVMPNDFIPMAEESDLIVGLGNEVLYKACVQMQKWKEQFGIEIKISINLAARQLLQVDLARHIENVVNRAGLAPKLVCLEITETAVMEDLKRARKILETLRSKGFKIAIDDFGTGYSSLNYLRNIPLDIIKIDYSFVKELLNNSVDQAIVSAIIEIGAALDLQVLAEGIETPEQKKMLLDKGCEIFQGYFFGRPIPAEEFTKYIENSIATIEANKVKQKA